MESDFLKRWMVRNRWLINWAAVCRLAGLPDSTVANFFCFQFPWVTSGDLTERSVQKLAPVVEKYFSGCEEDPVHWICSRYGLLKICEVSFSAGFHRVFLCNLTSGRKKRISVQGLKQLFEFINEELNVGFQEEWSFRCAMMDFSTN